MESNKLSALQTTVVAMVAVYMVGKAVYEVCDTVGKYAYQLGKRAREKFENSKCKEEIKDVIKAVEVELEEVKESLGKYICGWILVLSVVHSGYIYLKRFDYEESLRAEKAVKEKATEYGKKYLELWGIEI